MDERSKKSLYIIIWLIVATLLGTVYTSYLTPQKTHLVFGATYMTMNNPFYEVINNELRKEIEQNGDELIVRNPELDTDKQNEQIGSLTVVSNFSLTKSLKTLIISMLLSFFIVKFVKIIVLIWANVCYNGHRR